MGRNRTFFPTHARAPNSKHPRPGANLQVWCCTYPGKITHLDGNSLGRNQTDTSRFFRHFFVCFSNFPRLVCSHSQFYRKENFGLSFCKDWVEKSVRGGGNDPRYGKNLLGFSQEKWTIRSQVLKCNFAPRTQFID